MALPSSGAISVNAINVELGKTGTTTSSLGQSDFRSLAGVASGAISMSNFHGKAWWTLVTGSLWNMTSNTTPAPFVVDCNDAWYDGTNHAPAFRPFNSDTADNLFFSRDDYNAAVAVIDCGRQIRPVKFRIDMWRIYGETEWQIRIQGSNDNLGWTNLWAYDVASNSQGPGVIEPVVSDAFDYRYFRVYLVRQGTSLVQIRFYEFRLLAWYQQG